MSQQPETKETDFPDTKQGWALRLQHELSTAKEKLAAWHKQGADVVKRYRDDREQGDTDAVRWNLFTSNTETLMATLYGQTPKVSVERRYADAEDDVARVGGELLERILNADFEKEGDTAEEAFRYALEDRLLPGAGVVRVRYEAKAGEEKRTPPVVKDGRELAPEVVEPTLESQCVHVDYVHWRDVLWGPARVWHEVPWLAYRNEMSRAEVAKRFGEDMAARVPLHPKAKDDDKKPAPWARAEVWEVWHKPSRRVFWWAEGVDVVLDDKPDTYGLDGFFPSPRPLFSLVTTTGLVPKPTYLVAQDLYREVDNLSARIDALTDAMRVRGAYDAANPVLADILTKPDNTLVPVPNWAAFGERGGLEGAIQWMPLEQVAKCIALLVQQRAIAKDAIFEVTGQADIQRGVSTQGEAATTSAVKAKFGSVRLQRLQDEFARFVTDTVRLKAQLVCRYYDAPTLVAQSNMDKSTDAALVQAAADFVKSGLTRYRLKVEPEAIALQDMAALKSEAVELLQGVAGFMQAMAPFMTDTAMRPHVLRLLQASLARVRGAAAMEGVVDDAIKAAEAAAKQAAANPQAAPPDPEQSKQATVALKAQADLAKEKAKHEYKVQEIGLELQADAQREVQQREQNTMEAQAKASISAANRPVRPAPGQGGAL